MTAQEHDLAINSAAAYLALAQETVRAMAVTNRDPYDRIRLARLARAHMALAEQLAILEVGSLEDGGKVGGNGTPLAAPAFGFDAAGMAAQTANGLDDHRPPPVSLDRVRQQRQRGR